MANRKMIVFGAGGHALVVADAVKSCGDTVVGYTDTVSPEKKGRLFNGAPIIGGFEDMLLYVQEFGVGVVLGFGNCAARHRIIQELADCNIRLSTVIHPKAIVSQSAELGDGVYIGPNSVVEGGCRIGDCTIINCGASVCHECQIGSAVSVCPGVVIGGKTVIGDRSWIGIGATCIDKIRIGSCSYVGAGAVVVADVPDNVLVVGVPARVVKCVDFIF